MKAALILTMALLGQTDDPIMSKRNDNADNRAFAQRAVQLSKTKEGRKTLLEAAAVHKGFDEVYL